MPKIAIETTQNVTFERQAATVADRMLATLIDWAVIAIFWLFMGSFLSLSLRELFSDTQLIEKIFLILPIMFYHPLMEYFNNGRSLGKMVVKTKVIQLDGSIPTFNAIALRWLMRTIDFQLFFLVTILFFSSYTWLYSIIVLSPLVAVFAVVFSNKGQRIGDIVADTTVVKITRRARLEDTILRHIKKGYTPQYTNVLRLSDKDIHTIKEALEYYYNTNNGEHIRTLTQKAKKLLDVNEKVRPSKFLERLIKDYNHLAVEKENKQG